MECLAPTWGMVGLSLHRYNENPWLLPCTGRGCTRCCVWPMRTRWSAGCRARPCTSWWCCCVWCRPGRDQWRSGHSIRPRAPPWIHSPHGGTTGASSPPVPAVDGRDRKTDWSHITGTIQWYIPMEAAEGRTAHNNGWNGANGMVLTTCLIPFHWLHSRH